MKKILYVFLLVLFHFSINANEQTLWNNDYQNVLMEKVGQKVMTLSTYPSIEYPNSDSQPVLKKYPEGKILLFGYGSLINADSAGRSVSQEAVQSMQPVVALALNEFLIIMQVM